MANKDYIERLKQVIFHLHKTDSKWIESVPVHDLFQGKTVWQGVVEVFELRDHPKAKRGYAWSYRGDGGLTDEQFVAVLEIPPVKSPETAVQVYVASEVRKAQKRKK